MNPETRPYDAVDENDELLPEQPFCQAEPHEGGTLCDLLNGHEGDHVFSTPQRGVRDAVA